MKFIAILVAAAFVAACGSLPKLPGNKTYVAKSQAEAGAVYITANPPLPWSEVSSLLKPEFEVKSANELLDKVLRVTIADEYSYRSGFSAGFQANLAGRSFEKSTTVSDQRNLATGDVIEATRTVNNQQTYASGERPELSTDGTSFAEQGASIDPKALGVDPFLQYRTAAALFQEIKLLNNYLSARIENEDKTAYLIRTQISLQPYLRNQPFDVYSRIWVTCAGEYGSDAQSPYTSGATCMDTGAVDVIPLVIIDNYERSQTSRIAQAALRFEASLSAIVSGTGLGANVEKVKDELEKVAGNDYNSLLSISQSKRSELVVRLGAAYSPNSDFQMIPRTYEVTFLVLVPRSADLSALSVSESSVFRNSITGKRIPLFSDDYAQGIQSELRTISKNLGLPSAFIEELGHQISRGKFSALTSICIPPDSTKMKNPDACEDVSLRWPDTHATLYDFLEEIVEQTKVSEDIVNLPDFIRELPPTQSAILVDKGKSGSTITVSGARGITADENLFGLLTHVHWEKGALIGKGVPDFVANDLKNNPSVVPARWRTATPDTAEYYNWCPKITSLASESAAISTYGKITLGFPSPVAILGKASGKNDDFLLRLFRRDPNAISDFDWRSVFDTQGVDGNATCISGITAPQISADFATPTADKVLDQKLYKVKINSLSSEASKPTPPITLSLRPSKLTYPETKSAKLYLTVKATAKAKSALTSGKVSISATEFPIISVKDVTNGMASAKPVAVALGPNSFSVGDLSKAKDGLVYEIDFGELYEHPGFELKFSVKGLDAQQFAASGSKKIEVKKITKAPK